MERMRPGWAAFALVWLGQTVSLLGSAMTWFALTIWVFRLTGQATALALLGFFPLAPPGRSVHWPARWSTAGIGSK